MMKKTKYITTSSDDMFLINRAQRIALDYNLFFVKRNKKSLKNILQTYNINSIFVLQKERLVLETLEKTFFFHKGMSSLRVNEHMNKNSDLMLKVMKLEQKESILDCTLGLGNDFLVYLHFFNDYKKKIVCLESSFDIYLITFLGVKELLKQKEIKTKLSFYNQDYRDFFKNSQNNKFDLIYFDPMFENAIKNSQGIFPLRSFANYKKIDDNIIKMAIKFCNKSIVIKSNKKDKYIQQLKSIKDFDIISSKSSKIVYYTLDLEG